VRKVISFLTVLLLALVGAIGVSVAHNDGSLVSSSGSPSPSSEPTGSGSSPAPSEGATNSFVDLNAYYAQQLTWTDCSDGFECSTLQVPLDYADPGFKAISLAVVRLTSKQATESLVLNPGGPGGSGIEYARAASYVMTEKLRKHYNVVGFDPRGVGQSTPVDCLDDKQTDVYVASDGSPDNQKEIDETVAIYKQFAQACATKSAELFAHVDTVSATRDIDILRAALGDEKLNWFGKSYGTFLGATYAGLFPDKVGRMMLDGAIDPTLTNEQLSKGQALGFENALHRFLKDCPKHDDCPLKSDEASAFAQVMTMLNKLDTNPATISDGRTFTQAMGVTGVVGSLYDKVYGWVALRVALADALDGNFDALAQNVDFYTSRDSDGHYTDNSNDAIMAVNCLDRPDRATLAHTEELAQAWKKEAPAFGEYLAWGNIGCSYWQAPATGKPETITAKGAPTILVVGTVNDPATPYPWAKALAKQLDSGVLLTFTGDGHTAYFQGSDCVDKYVDSYYLTGKAAKGVVCSDGP
jgi:pimeloyl-ACP methyl ester carboxylesterase